MLPERIIILGGNSTAFAVAATLALDGCLVTLWEHPAQAVGAAAIREGRAINPD